MKLNKLTLACSAALVTAFGLAAPAHAQYSGDVIRIGFVTDMSGLYSDIDGPGGTTAIQMAIDDMGGAINGKKIEVLSADHQNKADIAAAKAREWFDTQGMDMLVGGTTSSTNLAMAGIAKEKNKLFISIGSASSALTNEQCAPTTIHYAYDTVALAKGTGSAVVKSGGDTWFFLTADYAFGHALEADTSKIVKDAGGKVVGAVRHPLSTSDFSSYLLQAQASKAKILGLANAGGDLINSIKAANEFGITKTMNLAGLLIFITDIHSLGLKQTQGMYLTDSWYWDYNDETRAWAKRFEDKVKRKPSSIHAADYSATLQYLKAVKAVGSDDTAKVNEYLRNNKINDMYTKDGYVRADGRMVHDMYLMQVKKPEESKQAWDYFKIAQVIKGDAAWTTKEESKCALWK